MKLVFAGTPEAAVPSLRTLAVDHEIMAVITREDAPTGRKRVLTPSPVAVVAAELGLVVIKANRLDETVTARVVSLDAALGVIVAYGGLVREPLLSVPEHGWINLHFSLLPAWRGAAPVQRAIIAGDSRGGATVFQLVPELDAGDILGVQAAQIATDTTAGQLLHALAESGAGLLADVVGQIGLGSVQRYRQGDGVSYAHKLTTEDARIDWKARGAHAYNRIRGVTPEPGAFTSIGGSRVKILEARLAPGMAALAPGIVSRVDGRVVIGTADQPVELVTVQPGGKNAMPANDWFRGLSHDTPVRAQ